MFRMIVQWLLSAVALMIVTRVVPGFYITGLTAALIAAVVIGFLNATLGYFLKLITFPLVILTFGLFALFINAAMIVLASKFVDGFYVYGYTPAVWAAAVLTVLGLIIRFVMQPE
ncbi:MAG: phage holin family protein [Terracidiphilus sp.]